MVSETHIMTYITIFPWLVVPTHGNRGRRLASIQAQVKNYYQRQVDSGKMCKWQQIANDADEKISRGEDTGPFLRPTILPNRHYDMQYQRQLRYLGKDIYMLSQLDDGYGSEVEPSPYRHSQIHPRLSRGTLAFKRTPRQTLKTTFFS